MAKAPDKPRKTAKSAKPDDEAGAPIRPLAHLNGVIPPAPDWFCDAINAPHETGSVEVEGAKICYSTWGTLGQPGLLLVHGGRAHRRWWHPFAPMLAEHYRVSAIDLSGLGDSHRRARYSLTCHAAEIFAVCEAAGLNSAGRPLVIGHSFGGWATLGAVEIAGERLGGAVIIDTPFGIPDPDEGYTIKMGRNHTKASTPDKLYTTNKIYPTIEEPISRFRLLPSQPGSEFYLLDYIARNGLEEARDPDTGAAGWRWKFDPAHGRNFDIHFDRDLFLAARCPLAFIYGEKSQFASGEGFAHMRKQARGRSPFMMIPEGHHHLMLDQPLAFITALRSLLTSWPVRVGF